MKQILALALVAFAIACGPAPTAPTQPEVTTLEVRDAWAAPTPGGVDIAGGYLTIVNGTDADERLISASSPRAGAVEIHEMSMDSNVMRMRALEDGLVIPRGKTASFQPGGLHLMFTGVTTPFVAGEDIPVTLTFEHAGVREVVLPVRANATGH